MIIAPRSPAAKPDSSRAAATGSAASPNCRYVRRERSWSRSASTRQTSSGQCPSASRSAAPSESYFAKSSIRIATEAHRHREKQDYMRNSSEESFYSASRSEPCLDAGGKCVEVADALYFVIREFNAEMIFQAREQFQGLQAVDPQLLVEIVAWLKIGARKFEMSSGKIQDLVRCLFDCFHHRSYFIGRKSPLAICTGFL